jgi:hypothetical protein
MSSGSSVKTTALVLPLVTCLSCAATEANAVMAIGTYNCGDWIQYQAQPDSWPALATNAWLTGYLSGYAFASNKDLLKGTNLAAISLWVTNYCRDHPLEYVGEAANALAHELIKRNGP